jgi:hypothetical protein
LQKIKIPIKNIIFNQNFFFPNIKKTQNFYKEKKKNSFIKKKKVKFLLKKSLVSRKKKKNFKFT